MTPRKFSIHVKTFYKKNGRHDLPWRKQCTPYRVIVSELMLQQTQVDRVIPFFKRWMKRFPDWRLLSEASSHDVLSVWKGLGYNSRALRLQKLAQIIQKNYKGNVSLKNILAFEKRKNWQQKNLKSELSAENIAHIFQKFPGIGPYTAGAILAFAFDIPYPCIETNIRRVYIHHFFSHATDILDKEILEMVSATLPTKNVREWYWALMDYGAYLGKNFSNVNRKSKHYTKQVAFTGSNREARSIILSHVLKKKSSFLLRDLQVSILLENKRFEQALESLLKDNTLVVYRGRVRLK